MMVVLYRTEWCHLIDNTFVPIGYWYREKYDHGTVLKQIQSTPSCRSRIIISLAKHAPSLPLILNSEVLIHFGHFKQNGANHCSQVSHFLVCLVIT